MTGPGLRGTGFGRLRTANAVSNVGDGITLAAGPLLVASPADNPALISLAVSWARCWRPGWNAATASTTSSASAGSLWVRCRAGFVAQAFGITAPFWLAFAVMVVFTACAWRLFSRSALDAERQQVGLEMPVT